MIWNPQLPYRKPVKYLGLLGSRRKVQTFTKQLSESGVSEAQLSRLHAPIGYDIGAETPHEIAISILAELLQVMNDAPGRGNETEPGGDPQSQTGGDPRCG